MNQRFSVVDTAGIRHTAWGKQGFEVDEWGRLPRICCGAWVPSSPAYKEDEVTIATCLACLACGEIVNDDTAMQDYQ